MKTATPEQLAPTDDDGQLELALVDTIAATCDPEMWIAVTFPQPDDAIRVRWTWTAGGIELGNHIDHLALGAGLDAADNFHLCDSHAQQSSRGSVRVHAHPLRPILTDVQAGVRAPDGRRALLQSYIDFANDDLGRTPRLVLPRWIGVGPDLLNRRAA